MKRTFESGHQILASSKVKAVELGISSECSLERLIKNQQEAEKASRKMFKEIISCIIKSITKRFSFLKSIVEKFEFLWKFLLMSEDQISLNARTFTRCYKDIDSSELSDELSFLKQIYTENFNEPVTPSKLLEDILKRT